MDVNANVNGRYFIVAAFNVSDEDADRAIKTVAGAVAQADTPTSEEVAKCRELLDMLGLRAAPDA